MRHIITPEERGIKPRISEYGRANATVYYPKEWIPLIDEKRKELGKNMSISHWIMLAIKDAIKK